jgi:hypothetical protein
MNFEIFTVEEENLICAFDISGRTALISEIRAAMPDFDEPEMGELAEIVIGKLEAMTDEEFSEISFNPAFGDEYD